MIWRLGQIVVQFVVQRESDMWGSHLKKRIGWLYYQRRRPAEYKDVESRAQISFAHKTKDLSEAKLKAAKISFDLESQWQKAKANGKSLKSQNRSKRYKASVEVQKSLGVAPKPSDQFSNDELLERLRILILGNHSPQVQKAIMGLTEKPKLSLSEGFNRFWEHIKDEWMDQSHDQRRGKRNVYLKSIRNFEAVIGKIPLYDIERRHTLKYRSWWLDRVKDEGLKPYTGNREINSLRRLVTVNFDIDASEQTNPFARVRLKETSEITRIPFSTEQIQTLLKPKAFGDLHEDFVLLFRLLVNTGMRPVEAIGLELDDFKLDHEVPHVHVRKNSTRGLKTDHSERLLPLLGVSLEAAKTVVKSDGWGDRAGKNMYATTIINKHLRESGVAEGGRQSLYSLRHWFQDQLTRLDVIDRAQTQLMGHKFHRPKYGFGKEISELRDIVSRFTL